MPAAAAPRPADASTPAAPPLDTPPARWSLTRAAPLAELEATMTAFRVSAPVAQVLWARGITPAMLEITPGLTPNAGLMQAAARIVDALAAGRRMRVHGDYDADGVSASATLIRGLRELGGDVHGFIPHRTQDGYGLNMARVPEHAAAAELLITVDCGVTGVKEVAELQRLGMEVIITDHHAPGPEFPDALVVHPQLTAHYDPARHNLTGAGVAYHLLWAVRALLGVEGASAEHPGAAEPRHLAPVATIGTIADVAPLLGENRALVTVGLTAFAHTTLAGLRALQGPQVGTSPTGRDVAFMLAPRINAAGRLGEADAALELLLTDDPARARELADTLETLNTERKAIQERMYAQALEVVDASERILVVTHPEWNPGVMGIVASKLVERYTRPVFIIAQGKGSVRCTPGISAVEGLNFCGDLLLKWGGHPGAAGFSIDPANIPAFRARLQDYAAQFPTPVATTEAEAPLPRGNHLTLLAELDTLEPFGTGHGAPAWHVRGDAVRPRLVGKTGQTLQVTVDGLGAVRYGHGTLPTGVIELAAELSRNTWRGQVSAQWMAGALRGAGALSLTGQGLDAVPPDAAAQVTRVDHEDALARLAAGTHAWSASTPALRRFLQTRGLPEVTDADGPGGVVCFDVPDAAALARWLRAGRAVAVCLGPRTLAALRDVMITPFVPEHVRAHAAAYHGVCWAHAHDVLDDDAFAAQVYSLAGLLPTPHPPGEH